MHSQDDFDVEPVPGLPENLPEGEHILWQGKPDTWLLARDSLNFNWIMGYFVLLGAWRTIVATETREGIAAFSAAVPFLLLGLATAVVLLLLAYLMASTTLYTLTNRRVAMRIGIALTVTLNLPYRWVESVEKERRKNGSGTLAIKLIDEGTRLSFMMCWPHCKPWAFNPARPAFRAIKNVDEVGQILADAAQKQIAEITERNPEPLPNQSVPAE